MFILIVKTILHILISYSVLTRKTFVLVVKISGYYWGWVVDFLDALLTAKSTFCNFFELLCNYIF